ncbi:MAG: acyltransferase [Prevotellaceae bacterium]|jgi:peptidoglycan/LPS O-acetylase OafA/YrhL|nr:acyltransferase [Prevotellaceae bacterium]
MKTDKNNIDLHISLDDTQVIKGIAICLMLWYHLILVPEYGYFAFQTARLGQVCVALFLFVSAYGLTVQYNKICGNPIAETFKFQAKRFVKFYTNYWVIFLIFVPIGVFVFGRHLSAAYGGGHWLKMLLTDFLGINGWRSYNRVWWFNQLIVYLYLLFPLLYFLLRKWAIPMLIFGIIVWEVNFPVIMFEAHEWLLQFMFGIVFALNVDKISDFLNKFNKWLVLAGTIILLGLLVIQRTFNIIPFFTGTTVDAFLAPIMAVLTVLLFRNIKYINTLFKFLGKHSMNIFMIHSFFNEYWFGNFIYSFQYPIVIFAVLMAICLIISMMLEYFKKIIKLPVLIKNINQKIENAKL